MQCWCWLSGTLQPRQQKHAAQEATSTAASGRAPKQLDGHARRLPRPAGAFPFQPSGEAEPLNKASPLKSNQGTQIRLPAPAVSPILPPSPGAHGAENRHGLEPQSGKDQVHCKMTHAKLSKALHGAVSHNMFSQLDLPHSCLAMHKRCTKGKASTLHREKLAGATNSRWPTSTRPFDGILEPGL